MVFLRRNIQIPVGGRWGYRDFCFLGKNIRSSDCSFWLFGGFQLYFLAFWRVLDCFFSAKIPAENSQNSLISLKNRTIR